ncbi:MAG: M20 family metallopeptidase [Candidatus Blackburnbacteria bacterium]|nr:M20 family metallopeptidase [Candidatus Blackburnbacteria bacterium]
MDTLQLTQKLISIPSFVDQSNSEGKLGLWLFDYLNTQFPYLRVEKQQVSTGRFNIIAKDKFPTRVVICDHIDTVQVGNGWNTNPFDPVLKGNKLYGLGATDTKGNVASILSAVKAVGPTKGLMLVFYVDEEYDFAGAKKFVSKYKNNLSPEIIASGDGGSLEIGNACRGLIEVIFAVRGKAGHAGNPQSGNNAVSGAFEIYQEVQKWLTQFSAKELGLSTSNLPWITGGQSKPNSQELGREGNVIPDYCEFAIEVRNASTKLNAKKLVKHVVLSARKKNLKVEKVKIRHDLGAWITKPSDLAPVSKVFNLTKSGFTRSQGYVDLQMFWEAFGKPTCFTFGAGVGSVAHKPNEYIDIRNLEKGEKYWTAFIKEYCSVQ